MDTRRAKDRAAKAARPSARSDDGPTTIFSLSEDETLELGRGVGRTLKGGELLVLEGDLGHGKTVFARGVAAGLGVAPEEVSSPSFTLVHEYRGGRLTLYHVDLYRLDRAAGEDLGLDELGVADGVLAIEWPDRLTHAFTPATQVQIDIVDDTTRKISIATRA